MNSWLSKKYIFLRIFIGAVISIIASSIFNISINEMVIQVLFAVLGILYSISVSNIISFNLNEIKNNNYRKEIYACLTKLRKNQTYDFVLATFFVIVGLSIEEQSVSFICFTFNSFNFICIYVFVVLISFVNGFSSILKLNHDVTERLISDDISKQHAKELKQF